ncbi:MAG: cupin domain-containing protein [Nitrospirota bacterium]
MISGYLRLLAVLGVCLLSPVGMSRGGGLLSEGQLPPVVDLIQELKSNPLRPEEDFRITRLVENADQSALLVQVRSTLPPHFHKHTREVVYFLQGEGVFLLEAESISIRDGAVLLIQPGEVHTFTNQGRTPAVFFVVTSPRFDERDRIMVQGEHGTFR